MPIATYIGDQNFSAEIKIGQARAMIFPGGKAVPVTDEVARILVKDHAREFTVVDDAGQPVKPVPETKPSTKKPEDSGAAQTGTGKPGK